MVSGQFQVVQNEETLRILVKILSKAPRSCKTFIDFELTPNENRRPKKEWLTWLRCIWLGRRTGGLGRSKRQLVDCASAKAASLGLSSQAGWQTPPPACLLGRRSPGWGWQMSTGHAPATTATETTNQKNIFYQFQIQKRKLKPILGTHPSLSYYRCS